MIYLPAISRQVAVVCQKYDINFNKFFDRPNLGVLVCAKNKDFNVRNSGYTGTQYYADSGGFQVSKGENWVPNDTLEYYLDTKPDFYFGFDIPPTAPAKVEGENSKKKWERATPSQFRDNAIISSKYTIYIQKKLDRLGYDTEGMYYVIHGDTVEENEVWWKVAKDMGLEYDNVGLGCKFGHGGLTNQLAFSLSKGYTSVHLLGLSSLIVRVFGWYLEEEGLFEKVTYDSSRFSFATRNRKVRTIKNESLICYSKEGLARAKKRKLTDTDVITELPECKCWVCKKFDLPGTKEENVDFDLVGLHNILIDVMQNEEMEKQQEFLSRPYKLKIRKSLDFLHDIKAGAQLKNFHKLDNRRVVKKYSPIPLI